MTKCKTCKNIISIGDTVYYCTQCNHIFCKATYVSKICHIPNIGICEKHALINILNTNPILKLYKGGD